MPTQSAITKKTLVTDELILAIEKCYTEYLYDDCEYENPFGSVYEKHIEHKDYAETLQELEETYDIGFTVKLRKRED